MLAGRDEQVSVLIRKQCRIGLRAQLSGEFAVLLIFKHAQGKAGAGRTVYMETQADSGGVTSDSNMITLVIP